MRGWLMGLLEELGRLSCVELPLEDGKRILFCVNTGCRGGRDRGRRPDRSARIPAHNCGLLVAIVLSILPSRMPSCFDVVLE